jgi:NADH-quinone oxidoreductase subunit F
VTAETPLTGDIRPDGEPLGIREYRRTGGYEALRMAVLEMTPAEVIEEVKASNLRGRGGAGFSTGLKWGFVPKKDGASTRRYLVANGDEMEPGTFKDRVLLEGNPHQLLEGMLLAAYAIQADFAYVFVRWAYREAFRRLRAAADEARDAGFIGTNICGSGFSLEFHVHVSAGRYMCGEETGLLNSLQGGRATPRTKPPFPPVVGLYGKPTVIQNIETLCNVPHIIRNGATWFRGLSLTEDGGTKLYGVSGKVNRPGIYELPMGTPIREIVEEHAQGMRDGVRLRAFLPGGSSTPFLVEEHLDLPMDFGHVQQAGSRLGTGTMIILDDHTCPVGLLHNMEHFYAQESCGWCTPCRDGLPWVEKTLRAIERGAGREEDLEVLELHCKMLGPGYTFCALAPGAVEPLASALRFFRADFEAHIHDRRCPWSTAS